MIDFFEKIVQGFFYAQYPFLHPQHWPYMLATAFALVVLVNGRRYRGPSLAWEGLCWDR